jgi:hypothetical protein
MPRLRVKHEEHVHRLDEVLERERQAQGCERVALAVVWREEARDAIVAELADRGEVAAQESACETANAEALHCSVLALVVGAGGDAASAAV